jgi:glyoxylase-like metal-dependent hydrolase (beta-lactamase superfamily II)
MPKAGELLQVQGPVWLVIGEQGGRFPRSHSVLIRDAEACALIDTGCGLEVLRGLRQQLPLDLVINTHTHPDHSAGNFLFDGIPIVVPEPGRSTAGSLRALSRRFFPQEPENRPIWRAFVRETMGFADQAPTGTFPVDGVLDVGTTRLEVLHAPGHAVDHCCFWLEDLGLLIGADVDLTRFGPWYGHVESDLGAFRRTIEGLRRRSPRGVLSSHRLPVLHDVERAFTDFLGALERREARLLELLRQERSLAELVDAAPIYGGFPYAEPLIRSWEAQMIRHHLAELTEQGRVVETGRGFVVRVSGSRAPRSRRA